MALRHLIALAVVLLIAACADPGVVYRTPIAEARQSLMATGLPPLVFGSQTPDLEVVADGDADIAWIARRDGVELFRYVAHLKPSGEATRVTLELKGAQGGPVGDIQKKLSEHPQIRDLYLVAMKERIASTLERRPFEMARIYPAMTAASLANMGALQASAGEAAAASDRSERQAIEQAYRDEAAGRR